jgi:WhiB family redox-sensing transcriptional regulator
MTAVYESRSHPAPVPPSLADINDLDTAADAFLAEFNESGEPGSWDGIDAIGPEPGADPAPVSLYSEVLDAEPEEDSEAEAAGLSRDGSSLAGVYGSAVWDAVDRELPSWNTKVTGSWRDYALCAQTDPDAFFPEQGGSSKCAKSICMQCPVRRECLEYALDTAERFGVWGGYSERERRVIARSREAHLAKRNQESEAPVRRIS